MLRFEEITYLYGLAALPVLLLLFVWAMYWRRQALARFGKPTMLMRLMPDASTPKLAVKFTLLLLALALLVVGLANPQVGTRLEEAKREGVDIMVALDVSRSMLAEDIRPNRLERAKKAIGHLVKNLENDRIGLIIFAGKAYIQLPLTTDYAAARMMLDVVRTDMVPVQGTAVAEAIDMAQTAFEAAEDKHNVFLLFSDGESHRGETLAAARNAARKNTIIHTIGVGNPKGAPIPIYRNNRRTGYHKDANGETVLTSLDESTLREVADIGHGMYLHFSGSGKMVEDLIRTLRELEQKEFETKVYTDYEDRFQYFIGLALFLLVAERMLAARRSRWMDKLNPFAEKEEKHV